MTTTRIPVIDRLLAKVELDDENGCWLWTGCLMKGYGQITIEFGHNALTHRVAYEHFVGAIPEGLVLDHLCEVTACCNPGHLEPVTQLVNIERSRWPDAGRDYWRSKTACRNGHDYTESNTHIRPDGRRRCRTCNRIWAQAQRDAS